MLHSLAITSTVLALCFGSVAGLATAQSPVRIMPLGDSITGSPGCWRALLWRKLQDAGIKNTKFVGTLPGQGCGFTYDGDNEGHGGFLATGIVSNKQLPGWLDKTHPDVVMMHLGTNDVWSHKGAENITEAFSTLVDWIRVSKKTMKILVAQIIPMNPPNCADCGKGVVDLNKATVTWAAAKTTSDSPITVVDCWTGFDDAKDTGDGVHPNSSGNQKMANCWYGPLAQILKDSAA